MVRYLSDLVSVSHLDICGITCMYYTSIVHIMLCMYIHSLHGGWAVYMLPRRTQLGTRAPPLPDLDRSIPDLTFKIAFKLAGKYIASIVLSMGALFLSNSSW